MSRGPGFINLTLKPAAWTEALRAALRAGAHYGKGDVGRAEPVKRRIRVGQSDRADACRPFAAAPCSATRSQISWRSRALRSPASTTSTTPGAQVDVLARFRLPALSRGAGARTSARSRTGLYPGDYLKPVGQALAAEHGRALNQKPEADWLPLVRARAIDMMMAMIREDLAALNVKHDVFFFRALAHRRCGPTRSRARSMPCASRARSMTAALPPTQGRADRGLGGSASRRCFARPHSATTSTGRSRNPTASYTYFASDIAYHKSKCDRGFRHLIDVWGSDHGGYIKRMTAAVARGERRQGRSRRQDRADRTPPARAASSSRCRSDPAISSPLREVVDEVGQDAVRFMMLYRKNDAVLDFDLAKVIEQSRDNPVFLRPVRPRARPFGLPQRPRGHPRPAG